MTRDVTRFIAPDFLSLTIGIVVFFIGVLITQRISFLRAYNIPEPVTGGFIAALAFWIGGADLIDPAMVALAGISLMIVFALVDWNDIAGNRTGWNVFISFGTLIVLADGLAKVGVIDWVGRAVSALLAGHSPMLVMTMFVTLFFVVHYMFASLTAHATALMPVMLAAGAAVPGMPVRTFAMLMCFSLGLMGVLTPYATGPAPVYFGSGYIERRDFWRLGFIFGCLFLATLLLIGVPTLMLLS